MDRIEFVLFEISLLLYLAATVLYIIDIYFGIKNFGKLPLWKISTGFSCQTVSLIIRFIREGHPPVATLFETLSLFSWITVFIYLIIIKFKPAHRAIGLFIMPLACIINACAIGADNDIVPLMPSLQSFWLFIHVPLCLLGYGFITIAFFSAIIYFIQEKNLKYKNIKGFNRYPSLMAADELCYTMVTAGFTCLTMGIISGSIWAQNAWGSYWSWDPKETWSLITWLLFAVYLHARYMGGWRGRRTNILIIIGFICLLITFVGVNYLFGGLHKYI
ncbi:MAG: c-type cytochrome biogenesis protein CcsB [Candidatus Eremiobacterota bacterium]